MSHHCLPSHYSARRAAAVALRYRFRAPIRRRATPRGRHRSRALAGLAFALALALPLQARAADGGNPVVDLETSVGTVRIELFPEQAPATVANFLRYVDSGFYDGTVFHRVIPGFVIQGGGFGPDMVRKPTNPPIANESANGLRNDRGTLSMARLSDPNSATSQFFINLKDNAPLDATRGKPGYAVFARVIKGMDVVDAIALQRTHTVGQYRDVPVEPIVLERATRNAAAAP